MAHGDWQHHADRDGLPAEGDGQSEREAAVTAAQRLLAGPSVVVERRVLLEMTALLRQAVLLLQRAIDQASVQRASGDDDPATRS
jgi:hypothetical protein